MSDATKAVFLSYASQDAEAAKRICEALRAVGVEVWFDQNELVGGDAWDSKIRGQIGSCALFVPVISANTQARDEGYFRLEWKLAVDRSHLMAHDKPFLLPVVIDATKDSEARVPPEFRAVQWTRLPGGETPPAFCARVKKLLGGEAAVAATEVGARLVRAQGDWRGQAAPLQKSMRPWLVPAILGVAAVAALALWQPWRAKEKTAPPASPAAAAPAVATAPISEARKLVAQARAMVDEGEESNRENYFLADELLKKAQALDATDGEVWAAQAQISADMILHSYDRSRVRLENLPVQGQRAIKLAPDSVEAQLGYACHLVVSAYLTADGVNFANEAAQRLEDLTRRAPNYHRIYRYLARAKIAAGKVAEALAVCDRSNAIGGGDPTALRIKTGQLLYSARYAEAAEVNQQSLALRPTGEALMMEVVLQLTWHGDLDGAVKALGRWPAWLALEDRGAFVASQVWLWRHEPGKAIAALAPVPRDFLNDTFFVGPKAGLLALAHEMAGNSQAARGEWENVKRVAARVAAEERADQRVQVWKAVALAQLGETTEAETIFRQLEQSNALRSEFWSCAAPSALLRIALGHSDQVVAKFDTEWRSNSNKHDAPAPRAALRLNPVFDTIRATPEFQKWMAAAPAPKAKEADANAAAALDPKSVAVLAFANMSADKDNEYFSDGLSEEILDKLARNPALRVMARTSSFSYKGKNVPIPQVGRELNVGTIIDGSVRRAGNQLRITAQLINAADGSQVWSETYNKELTTADIFAIQDEIAQKIATRLAPNSAPTQSTAAAMPTKNLAAYEAYLRGRSFQRRSTSFRDDAIREYQRAVALDPQFALAWAQLARSLVVLSPITGADATLASRAIVEARRLSEDAFETHMAAAELHYAQLRHDLAEQELAQAERLRPQTADVPYLRGRIGVDQGRWKEGIELLRHAAASDPQNGNYQGSVGANLRLVGWYAEAEQALDRAFGMTGADVTLFRKAQVYFEWKGDNALALKTFDAVPPDIRTDRYWESRWRFLRDVGDNAGALAAAGKLRAEVINGQPKELLIALTREALGDFEGARRAYSEALPLAERSRAEHPDGVSEGLVLARIHSGLGRKEESLAAAFGVLELTHGIPRYLAEVDAVRTQIYARFGMNDDAIKIAETQIPTGWWKRNNLLLGADWAELRKDARFRALAEKAPL